MRSRSHFCDGSLHLSKIPFSLRSQREVSLHGPQSGPVRVQRGAGFQAVRPRVQRTQVHQGLPDTAQPQQTLRFYQRET